MAPPVDEGRFALLRRAAALLAPYPGRSEFAFRLALICAITALDVQIYQTPEPALTIYVVFFVVKPDRAASVLTSAIMAVLITIIIGVVLLITMLVLDAPLWRVATIAPLSFCLLFAASASKLKPVGAIIALITGYALDILGVVHSGEVATRALLYAWLFVVIPACLSIAVNLLIGPPPRRLAERAIATRLRLAAGVLRGAGGTTAHAFAECLFEGPGEIPAWLKLAGAEHTANAADLAALAQAASSTCALLELIGIVVRQAETPACSARLALAVCLNDVANAVQESRIPDRIAFTAAPDPDAPPIVTASFAAIADILGGFAAALPSAAMSKPSAKSGFFVTDAFTNPIHTRYALKATAASMLCYILYSLLDWPGIHTCFITCYIVSLGTTAETMEKLTLRITGCVIGAALGISTIVFVMPGVTSIGMLMVIVAGAAFVSGWIAAGSPRIAYVGFQLAFAFFLCVVQGSGPQFDMTVARDRVIGILIGNLAVAVIFMQVWPETVATRVDPALAALLRSLASLTRETFSRQRWSRVGELQAARGAVGADLALTRYEPLSFRPGDDWTNCRERILDAVGECQGPLLLAERDGGGESIALRLDRLAGALEGRWQAPEPPDDTRRTATSDRDTASIINLSLGRLEQAVACVHADSKPGMTEDAPA